MSPLPSSLKAVLLPDTDREDRFTTTWAAESSYRIIDPDSSLTWGYITIDNTQRGPGLGGIRMVQDLSANEISRLARVMTMKNSLACLPYGGAKAGITFSRQAENFTNKEELLENFSVGDAKAGIALSRQTENSRNREELLEKLADCLFELPAYVPAPDMGSDEKDIQIIHNNHARKLGTEKHSRGGSGRPIEKGGVPIDDWELTAHGLFVAIKALESLDKKLNLSEAKFIVQGFGNVGAPTAMKLQESGATLVGASDIHTALWNPKGLDVQTLNKIRKKPGGLSNYPFEVCRQFASDKLDWLLEAPCDILIPAARPDAITARNADRIQCRYILQGANTPSSKPVEYYLHHHRNILSLTDFSVNAGGVIGCAVERKINMDNSYAEKVKQIGTRTYVENLIRNTITRNICEIYTQMKNDMIFRDSAWDLAGDRLKTQEVWL